MNRDIMLKTIADYDSVWDVIIIGGGATGLGTAVEAASRGYSTLLLEQADFAKGTSSRSTKLAHGGVRYLQQGDVSLVIEALHERGLMMKNAPHLVSNQAFIIPSYDWWGGPFYTVGMKVYDMLAGKLGLGPSKSLSREETLALIPTVEPEGLRGGVIYYDGQFDDARFAISLAQTCADAGGTLLNYMKVSGLQKSNGMVSGVVATDLETGKEYSISGRAVVNATGVFVDDIIRMDDPEAQQVVRPSQGVHIVLDKDFLPGDSAIMVPKTDDGRVLFVVPWNQRAIVGTTDTPVETATLEPRALEEEVNFILQHAARYLTKDPRREDVLSVFAGLRPLVNVGDGKSTAQISRSHAIMVTITGLVTITGGKWTTYRKMGEDAVNHAALIAGLEEKESRTKDLRLHGWLKNTHTDDPLFYYGSDAIAIRRQIDRQPVLGEALHPALPFLKAQVVWAVEQEMARTVEDFLARRTRALLLDARASMAMAPEVARLMARALGYDQDWIDRQVEAYTELAEGYVL